jgi:TolB protein
VFGSSLQSVLAQTEPAGDLLSASSPVWSPTGQHVAFTGFDGVKEEVYVMNAEGADLRRLTSSPPGVQCESLAWFPGNRIIVICGRPLDQSSQSINVMNADGSGRRILTSGWSWRDSSWAPDARRIAYVARGSVLTDVVSELHVRSSEDAQPVSISTGLPTVLSFSWSADSRHLVFETHHVTSAQPSGWLNELGIHVAAADGSGKRRLTGRTERAGSLGLDLINYEPVWSSGGRVAFVSVRDGLPQIFSMSADGGGQAQLTLSGRNQGPSWSPDGRRIAFLTDRDGAMQVHVMDADGSGRMRLSRSAAVGKPVWAPDGRRIAYTSAAKKFNPLDPSSMGAVHTVNTDGTGDTKLMPRR